MNDSNGSTLSTKRNQNAHCNRSKWREKTAQQWWNDEVKKIMSSSDGFSRYIWLNFVIYPMILFSLFMNESIRWKISNTNVSGEDVKGVWVCSLLIDFLKLDFVGVNFVFLESIWHSMSFIARYVIWVVEEDVVPKNNRKNTIMNPILCTATRKRHYIYIDPYRVYVHGNQKSSRLPIQCYMNKMMLLINIGICHVA